MRTMETQAIRERIEKTEETIGKKKALIEKRLTAIGKIHREIGQFCGAEFNGTVESARNFENAVNNVWEAHRDEICKTYGDSDNYYAKLTEGQWGDVESAYYNLTDYIESIKNAQRDIEEREKTLETYRNRLAEAEERDNVFETMPDCMREFLDSIIESWDLWDKMRKESVKTARNDYYALSDEYRKAVREHGNKSDEAREINKEMREIEERYSRFEWIDLPYLNEEQIHERNVKAGKSLVLDLYDRVSAITGTFEDANNLKVTRGNEGYAVINGFVTGNGRTAKVQSIGAGGYNIQRFHIRTLVHEVH